MSNGRKKKITIPYVQPPSPFPQDNMICQASIQSIFGSGCYFFPISNIPNHGATQLTLESENWLVMPRRGTISNMIFQAESDTVNPRVSMAISINGTDSQVQCNILSGHHFSTDNIHQAHFNQGDFISIHHDPTSSIMEFESWVSFYINMP